MSLSGFGALAVGRKVTNPFIYLPIAFLQKYENRLCLAAGDLAKKLRRQTSFAFWPELAKRFVSSWRYVF
nr:hypothetical protein [Proteus terrae subsp. cibarius]